MTHKMPANLTPAEQDEWLKECIFGDPQRRAANKQARKALKANADDWQQTKDEYQKAKNDFQKAEADIQKTGATEKQKGDTQMTDKEFLLLLDKLFFMAPAFLSTPCMEEEYCCIFCGDAIPTHDPTCEWLLLRTELDRRLSLLKEPIVIPT